MTKLRLWNKLLCNGCVLVFHNPTSDILLILSECGEYVLSYIVIASPIHLLCSQILSFNSCIMFFHVSILKSAPNMRFIADITISANHLLLYSSGEVFSLFSLS